MKNQLQNGQQQKSHLLVGLISLVTTASAWASPGYYTISENVEAMDTPVFFQSPMTLMHEEFQQNAKEDVNLLNWVEHKDPLQQASEPYNRSRHFGSWKNEKNDGKCFNVRAEVLIRDSLSEVTYNEPRKCTVKSGSWVDPYSGDVITDASRIQIDHFVPLKNAYISGGWKWDRRQRCIYTNFMANNYHLISVSGQENMRKSDKTPADYLPSNQAFICTYLNNWLKVKATWRLVMLPEEAEAIESAMTKHGCEQQEMVLSEKEMRRQRKEIAQISNICGY